MSELECGDSLDDLAQRMHEAFLARDLFRVPPIIRDLLQRAGIDLGDHLWSSPE
jgi:hypothetical protein